MTRPGRQRESGGFCEVRVGDVDAMRGRGPHGSRIERSCGPVWRYGDCGLRSGLGWWAQWRMRRRMAHIGLPSGLASACRGGRKGPVWQRITFPDGRNLGDRVTRQQVIWPVLARIGDGSRGDGLSRALMSCRSRRACRAVPGRGTRRPASPSGDRSRDKGAERVLPSLPVRCEPVSPEPVRPAAPCRLRAGSRAGRLQGSRNDGCGERRPAGCAAGSAG